MSHSIWLFYVKYFTKLEPAIATYEYESTSDFLFEITNGYSLRVHPGQWKMSKGQPVLLENILGTYYMYQPISQSDYDYLTK